MKNCIYLFLIFTALTGYAREDILFRHITMADGLSDNQINHITRDSQGFMWFSTSHGLNRYDGYTFKVVENTNSWNSSYIVDVQEDASGMLWIRDRVGDYKCFDPEKEILLNACDVLTQKYGVADKPSLIYIDQDKNLWMHNDAKGTLQYNFKSNKLSPEHVAPAGPDVHGTVTGFAHDRQGILRIYTDGYFDHINPLSNKVDYINDSLVKSYDNMAGPYYMFVDMDGDYWIWNFNGIRIFHTGENRWEYASSDPKADFRLSGNHVRSIVNDMNGRIWVAIDHGGINIIDKKDRTLQYLTHEEIDDRSLIENCVYSLYADPFGGIWAGTFKRGVSYYNENLSKTHTDRFSEFYNIDGFIPDVNSIAEDSDGNLYLGLTNGIIRVDNATKKKTHTAIPTSVISFPNDVITSILPTKDGKLFLGTYQSGLIVYDRNKFTRCIIDTDNKDSYANSMIYSLAADKNGYLWIGTWGAGLWGLDPHTGKAKKHVDINYNTEQEHIASICLSKDGNVYMATPYYLLIYNTTTGRYEKLRGNRGNSCEFSNPMISHIFEDSRGLLWLSSVGGLNIYDRRNDSIAVPAELRSSIIYGVAEDNNNTMWVSAADGIYHIIANSNNNGYSYSVSRYSDLAHTDYQQFNAKSIIKTSQGKILAGGTKGLSILKPDSPQYDTAPKKAHFTGISLFNKNILIDSIYHGNRILEKALNYTDRIDLDYDQNILTVSFSDMDYSGAGKNGYMYMLDGFDSDWAFTTDNKITYTNLAPGTYILKVKTVNHSGRANKETAELKIDIAPPFYLSWPAYILYALILVGIVLLIYAYMRHNEAQKYKLLQVQQEARQKHELDNMKLHFFTNISHDLRTPLTLILTPLEYVMERVDSPELKEKLRIARNNAMRLLDMVNELLDFRKSDLAKHTLAATGGDIVETIRTQCNNFVEYAEQRSINLTFFSPVGKLYIMFDEDKISKIIMNLLSNAFKFTPESGRVDVSLDITSEGGSETLEIKVADNGCGISDEHKKLVFDRFYQAPRKDGKVASGSGVGLNLVKEFVTLHKGTIEVLDNISKGAVFVIRIPIERVNAAEKDLPETELKKETETGTTEPALAATEKAEEQQRAGKNMPQQPSVLLVDDNDDFRMFMRDCLKSEYTIHEAADGAAAWAMVPELQPDIIISDVMMPEMDGNELCKRVKSDIRTSHILVVLLTARAAKEHEQKGLETGADDYITKPFNLNILNLRIKNLLQRRKSSYGKHIDVSPSKINITSLDEKLIDKAIRYVEENMSRSDLSVEELSAELGMSRVHLYKKLLSITGKTSIEFIRVLRLKRAAQLLRESQMNISEITYQTGFNNLNLFRKYFKAEFGMLPSEYQAKFSKKNDNLHNKI